MGFLTFPMKDTFLNSYFCLIFAQEFLKKYINFTHSTPKNEFPWSGEGSRNLQFLVSKIFYNKFIIILSFGISPFPRRGININIK